MVTEARALCGCQSLRSTMTQILEEETAARLAEVADERRREVDRRVRQRLLKQRAAERARQLGTSLRDPEPLDLSDLTPSERREVESIIRVEVDTFFQHFEARKAAVLAGEEPLVPAVAPVNRGVHIAAAVGSKDDALPSAGGDADSATSGVFASTLASDTMARVDSSLADLMALSGLEAVPPAPQCIRDAERSRAQENDALLRNVLALVTENRRLRQQVAQLQEQSNGYQTRISKLNWRIGADAARRDAVGRLTAAADAKEPASKTWLPELLEVAGLPAQHLEDMANKDVQAVLLRRFRNLQQDLAHAEDVVTRAVEERSQAELLLAQQYDQGALSVVEALRDAEAEIQVLKRQLKAANVAPGTPGAGGVVRAGSSAGMRAGAGGGAAGADTDAASPLSVRTSTEASNPGAHNPDTVKSMMALDGPHAGQFRLERALRLGIVAAEAAAAQTPIAFESVHAVADAVATRSRNGDAFEMPNFDMLVGGRAPSPPSPVEFPARLPGAEHGSPHPLSGAKASDVAPRHDSTTSPLSVDAPVVRPARFQGDAAPRVSGAGTPPSPRGVGRRASLGGGSLLPRSPSEDGARVSSASSLARARLTADLKAMDSGGQLSGTGGKPPLNLRQESRRAGLLSGRASTSGGSAGGSSGAGSTRRLSMSVTSGSSVRGGRARSKPSTGAKLAAQQSSRGFNFRVLREADEMDAIHPGASDLSPHETGSVIAMLYEVKIFQDAKQDLELQPRLDFFDVAKTYLLEKYKLQTLAQRTLKSLRA